MQLLINGVRVEVEVEVKVKVKVKAEVKVKVVVVRLSLNWVQDGSRLEAVAVAQTVGDQRRVLGELTSPSLGPHDLLKTTQYLSRG